MYIWPNDVFFIVDLLLCIDLEELKFFWPLRGKKSVLLLPSNNFFLVYQSSFFWCWVIMPSMGIPGYYSQYGKIKIKFHNAKFNWDSHSHLCPNLDFGTLTSAFHLFLSFASSILAPIWWVSDSVLCHQVHFGLPSDFFPQK